MPLDIIKERPLQSLIFSAFIAVCTAFITSYFQSKSTTDAAMATAKPEILRILQQHNTELSQRLTALENRVDSLMIERGQLRSRIAELERDLAAQQKRVKTLEAYPENMPGPAWLKGTKGKYLVVNSAYERQYNMSRWQFINFTDFDVWPEETAKQFDANDKKVLECRCSIQVQEKVPSRAMEEVSENNPLEDWLVWKWPVVDSEGYIIGVAGAAFKI